MKPFRVSDAGFNRGRDRTVAGNAGSVEVIEEDYHDVLDAPISERREKMRRFTRQVNPGIQERGKKVIGGDEGKG